MNMTDNSGVEIIYDDDGNPIDVHVDNDPPPPLAPARTKKFPGPKGITKEEFNEVRYDIFVAMYANGILDLEHGGQGPFWDNLYNELFLGGWSDDNPPML